VRRYNSKVQGAQLKLAATESKPEPVPVAIALGAKAIMNSQLRLDCVELLKRADLWKKCARSVEFGDLADVA
jgi:hypothetical protein